MNNRDKLLTPAYVAKLLKLHVSCVWRWILRNKIRSVRRRGTVYVPRSELVNLQKQKETIRG